MVEQIMSGYLFTKLGELRKVEIFYREGDVLIYIGEYYPDRLEPTIESIADCYGNDFYTDIENFKAGVKLSLINEYYRRLNDRQ